MAGAARAALLSFWRESDKFQGFGDSVHILSQALFPLFSQTPSGWGGLGAPAAGSALEHVAVVKQAIEHGAPEATFRTGCATSPHRARGAELHRGICRRDLEGIVVKWKHGAYVVRRRDKLEKDQKLGILTDCPPMVEIQAQANRSTSITIPARLTSG
jgi:hypothetical protein